jgi:spermidine/putrescine transport system substrate-binding protein
MKKFSMLILALAFMLAGCNSETKTLKVFNWGVYMDASLIDEFEEEYNVRVVYDEFDSNESMYTKLMSGEKYDVLVPSDYMVQRLIEENLLQKIDRDVVSLDDVLPNLLNKSFDLNNDYSAPYFWGNVGILYDTTKVDVNDLEAGWDILLNVKYKGDIYFYDSERDAFLVALKALGYSTNSKDDAQLNKAFDWLTELNTTMEPIYVTDDVLDNMIAGNKAIAIVYSGDAAYILDENEDMAYYVPEAGTNLWVDSMVIPANADNPELANAWIAFMLSEDAQSRNTLEVGYSTVHKTVYEFMISDDGDFAGNEAYAVRTDYDKDEIFKYDQELKVKMSDLWLKIKAQ